MPFHQSTPAVELTGHSPRSHVDLSSSKLWLLGSLSQQWKIKLIHHKTVSNKLFLGTENLWGGGRTEDYTFKPRNNCVFCVLFGIPSSFVVVCEPWDFRRCLGIDWRHWFYNQVINRWHVNVHIISSLQKERALGLLPRDYGVSVGLEPFGGTGHLLSVDLYLTWASLACKVGSAIWHVSITFILFCILFPLYVLYWLFRDRKQKRTRIVRYKLRNFKMTIILKISLKTLFTRVINYIYLIKLLVAHIKMSLHSKN